MQRLDREQPGLYGGSLRTLQRRMTNWRVANAKQVAGMRMEESKSRKTTSSAGKRNQGNGEN